MIKLDRVQVDIFHLAPYQYERFMTVFSGADRLQVILVWEICVNGKYKQIIIRCFPCFSLPLRVIKINRRNRHRLIQLSKMQSGHKNLLRGQLQAQAVILE